MLGTGDIIEHFRFNNVGPLISKNLTTWRADLLTHILSCARLNDFLKIMICLLARLLVPL